MTLKTKIARLILIGLAAAIATSAPVIAQETPAATKNTLPAVRTLTSADGRKLDMTITEKTATTIKGKTAAGKEITIELAKLSAEDQTFIATLQAPTTATPVATGAGKFKILYLGANGDCYGSLAGLAAAGYEIVPMDPRKLRKTILTGDLAIFKDYDVVWNELGGKEFEASNVLMFQEIEKLKRVLVTQSGYKNMSKKDLLENKLPERPDERAFIKMTDNFIFFESNYVMGKGPVKVDEKIVKEALANLPTLLKTYHR